MENGLQVMMYTSSFTYDPEHKIMFSETDEKQKSVMFYTIEKVTDQISRLTMDFYLHKNPLQQLFFKLTGKHKMEVRLKESLEKLDPLVTQMVLPLEF